MSDEPIITQPDWHDFLDHHMEDRTDPDEPWPSGSDIAEWVGSILGTGSPPENPVR